MKFTKINEKEKIVQHLKQNGLVLMETDTILGLYCKDQNKIYRLKNRPETKKIVQLIADVKQIGDDLPTDLLKITKRFWPGALTIIYHNVSYRIPNHQAVIEILKEVAPIYCSSANVSGEPFFRSSVEAIEKFADNPMSKELLVVDGKSYLNMPSTIYNYDLNKIVREGPISYQKIQEARNS